MKICRKLIHLIDGKPTSIEVSFSDPEPADVDWVCKCTVTGIKINKEIKFYGIDPFQAFTLCARTVNTYILESDYYKQGNIYFENPGELDLFEGI